MEHIMDFKSLNTFIQVAELNSFTKAGEKLGYSQPTVSFQIKQLEEELGIQLFERIGHTINLTDGGRQALAYAQEICRMSDKMIKGTSTDNHPKGNINLAMADSLCTPLIINSFSKFRETYPEISLNIKTAGTNELFRLLDHNEADIVCTLDNHIYSTNYVISNEEKVDIHFICSADNPLAHKNSLTIHDLLTQPFLLTEKDMSYRRLLDENMAKNNIEIQPVLEIGSADLICKLIEQNMGLSFLPDYVTNSAVKKGNVVRLNVQDFNVELWKQLLYHRDKWVSKPMQAVLEYLSDINLL